MKKIIIASTISIIFILLYNVKGPYLGVLGVPFLFMLSYISIFLTMNFYFSKDFFGSWFYFWKKDNDKQNFITLFYSLVIMILISSLLFQLNDSKELGNQYIWGCYIEYAFAGQGTVGLEILSEKVSKIDYLLLPIGGGGLAAGVSTVFKKLSPKTKIIGVEPEGAPSMQQAIYLEQPVLLDKIDRFVDGAAVKKVGKQTYEVCKDTLDKIILVPEGKVCTTILQLYNEEAMVVEPAGALSIAALDFIADEIKGKKVVCIVSGSNNDIERTEEIKERSLMYEGLKHYFMIQFPQRPGALREFVNEVLSESDDIIDYVSEYAF